MIDQYWRFPTRQDAINALVAAKVINAKSLEPLVGAIDWLGEVYYGGKYDFAAKRLVSPPLAYSGYHVNYRGPQAAIPAQFVVSPKVPSRRFA